jgi:hypothetical protein
MPADLMGSNVSSRMHVDHCIEALRLTLMCHGDTTPLFIMNDSIAPHGIRADFSPHHKCRKFDKLRTWMKKNQGNTIERTDFRPEGYRGPPPKQLGDDLHY